MEGCGIRCLRAGATAAPSRPAGRDGEGACPEPGLRRAPFGGAAPGLAPGAGSWGAGRARGGAAGGGSGRGPEPWFPRALVAAVSLGAPPGAAGVPAGLGRPGVY